MPRLLSFVANTGLVVVALVVLAAPLLIGQLVGSYQSGALGESTTAESTTSAGRTTGLFAVQTNPQQFAPYIEFDPQPVIDTNTYQTSVTFTTFTKQQAAYNGLITITNTSQQPAVIQAQVGTISGLAENSKVWLSLASDAVPTSTLSTKAAIAGATAISVASTTGFNSGIIVIENQQLTATATDPTTLTLNQPLAKPLTIGQKVYFGPAYFANQAKPSLPSTQSVSLLPAQSISLNLVVATESGDLDTNQLVLPIIITGK